MSALVAAFAESGRGVPVPKIAPEYCRSKLQFVPYRVRAITPF